jgi:hypothetical protein
MTDTQFSKKVETLASYVAKRPGCTPAQACKALRFEYPADMVKFRTVVAAAIEGKKIKRTGAGRGTTYQPE